MTGSLCNSDGEGCVGVAGDRACGVEGWLGRRGVGGEIRVKQSRGEMIQ